MLPISGVGFCKDTRGKLAFHVQAVLGEIICHWCVTVCCDSTQTENVRVEGLHWSVTELRVYDEP